MKNYLQTIRQVFSRDLMRHLAARLGERENAVSKALQGMVPMVLCQVVIQTSEGEGGAMFAPMLTADWPGDRGVQNLTQVLALLGGGTGNSGALDAGEGLLHRLFGANRPALDGMLCAYAGIRLASARALLGLVAAVLAGGLAQYARKQQLGVVRLCEEVAAAKSQIYNWLPADMPRWPGFRCRTAVRAPHAVWAAELARPYLLLAAAGAMVLAILVLGAVARPANPSKPTVGLAGTSPH